MVTYKTKEAVIYDALTPSKTRTAYASIDLISIDASAWIASGEYYTLDDQGNREVLQILNRGFTAEQVAAMEQQYGIVSKNSPEAIQELMIAAMPAILAQENIFGLAANKWELVA